MRPVHCRSATPSCLLSVVLSDRPFYRAQFATEAPDNLGEPCSVNLRGGAEDGPNGACVKADQLEREGDQLIEAIRDPR